MRLITVLAMFFLTLPASGMEDAGTEQADQPKAQGMIYATVKVADDLKTEFLDGPNSELPAEIVAKVSPSLMTRARQAHSASPVEDGVYRVAIDWNIVSVDGQEQMKFAFSNAQAFPVRQVKPVFRRQNSTQPVEITYRIGVAADGSVTGVERDDESSGNPDLYRAGREALKQWQFSPRYQDGIAVAEEIRYPLTFDLTAEQEAVGPQMRGL